MASDDLDSNTKGTIENLVAHVFAIRNGAHLAHWRTKSFAQHMALGSFYDEIIDQIDSIVEAYQGQGKLIGNVQGLFVTEPNIEPVIRSEMEWIRSVRDKVADGNTEMQNLIDDLIGTYSTTLYKLKFLQ
jgi:DNA-binding ferritin-like protein